MGFVVGSVGSSFHPEMAESKMKEGFGLGSIIAAVLSYSTIGSIPWLIVDTLCGWFYVGYYLLTFDGWAVRWPRQSWPSPSVCPHTPLREWLSYPLFFSAGAPS